MRAGWWLWLGVGCSAPPTVSWAPDVAASDTGSVDNELVELPVEPDEQLHGGETDATCPPGPAIDGPPVPEGTVWRLVACLGDGQVEARFDVLSVAGSGWCGTSHHLVSARSWTSDQGLDFVELEEVGEASPAASGHLPAGCTDAQPPTVWALAWGYARFVAADGSTDRLPVVRSTAWSGGARLDAWGPR